MNSLAEVSYFIPYQTYQTGLNVKLYESMYICQL